VTDVRERQARPGAVAGASPPAAAEPLSALLERTAAAAPRQLAVRQRQRAWTYAELRDRVDRLAAGLARVGIDAGERVAIHLPPGPEFTLAYFAALALGAVVVPSDPAASGAALEHPWNDAGVAAVIVDETAYTREVVTIRARLPARAYIVVPHDAGAGLWRGWPGWIERRIERLRASHPSPPSAVSPAVHRIDELLVRPTVAARRTRGDAEAIAAIHYTSPAAGVAKGAVHSHRSLLAAAMQLGARVPAAAGGPEVFGVAQHAAHGLELAAGLLLPLIRAATVLWLDPELDGAALLAALAQQHVTTLVAEPELLSRLLAAITVPAALPQLRACVCPWGLDEPLRAHWREQLGRVALLECFGAGEACVVTHVRGLETASARALGEPVPGLEVQVRDPTDRRTPCPRGELWVRGAQVMRGYWGRPDPTQALLRDGWLDTGESVEVDASGALAWVDAASPPRRWPGAGRP
jgi:long-chain acyl-CoA synthetase